MTTAGGRGPQMWDERYAAAERVWSAGPNREVERIVAAWVPGRALDLGAGEGRHALWLAELGWQVTAVDFSAVGIDRGRREAESRGLAVDWVVEDVTTWHPPEGTAFDLALVAYLHIPEDVFSRLGRWLAPGGALVVVGHALRNLTEGVGGPQDPALLHTTEQLRAAARDLDIERCEEVVRSTDAGDAIDVVLVARRPAG
ncbi:MAG TPA: class I SAM-dependent methyltransferase [Pedococcus sp.]|nr:class I SAM-dependent methyltransferase [Pedococcus sp.]